jgi:hypothetical protein
MNSFYLSAVAKAYKTRGRAQSFVILLDYSVVIFTLHPYVDPAYLSLQLLSL